MSKSESGQLTALVGVRLHPDEYAAAARLAAEVGTTVPTLIRALFLDRLSEERGTWLEVAT